MVNPLMKMMLSSRQTLPIRGYFLLVIIYYFMLLMYTTNQPSSSAGMLIFSFASIPSADIPTVERNTLSSSSLYPFVNEEEAIKYEVSIGFQAVVSNEDITLSIQRGWWNLSKVLITKAHRQGVDVSAAVRTAVAIVAKHTQEVVHMLNKQHDAITTIPPAFQWGQSFDKVFLNIKFAYRWNSPGALSVENELIETFENHFYFAGIGSHSGRRKKYELKLELLEPIVPSATVWNFASVGKLTATLQKQTPRMWERLTLSEAKIPNMQVWLDMTDNVELDSKQKKSSEGKTAAPSTTSEKPADLNPEVPVPPLSQKPVANTVEL